MISVKNTYVVMNYNEFNCDLTSIGTMPSEVECKTLAEANSVRDKLRQKRGIYFIAL